ncbi:hypothetical protein NBRC116583_08150 [Arenicella sp. 4NH20-0111]|uniref:hypothetical protein n=1 Tax=Arenicella sp. 4NH20-0111 TaxID=3127648 RepID=UPI003108C457
MKEKSSVSQLTIFQPSLNAMFRSLALRVKGLFILAMTMFVLSGCVSTGSIDGVSDGKAVRFSYEQSAFENDGKLEISMPDGELYSGKFVQSSSSKSGDDWIIGESSDDDSLVLKDSTTVSSRTSALLLGNRGSTMKCKFQFSNPDVGIDGGGIGQCHTSKEQTVSVTF